MIENHRKTSYNVFHRLRAETEEMAGAAWLRVRVLTDL